MQNNYKLKYSSCFNDIFIRFKGLTLSLTTYLKMQNIAIVKNEIISLIKQVKANMEKKLAKKLDIEFHNIYCHLIENVVYNFKEEDLLCSILDNYGVAQIILCNMVVQWIKTKEEVVLDKNEIKRIFFSLNNFIKREYGDDFFELLNIMGLYNKDNIDKIINPIDAIRNASALLKNFHPCELNSSLNAFIVNNYDKFKKYGLIELGIIPGDLTSFINNYKNVLKLLIIVKRMEKYEEKSRLNFFMEFKAQNDYLDQINYVLFKIGKTKLLNLDNEKQDLDLINDKCESLFKMNKKLKEKSNKILNELNAKKKEANELKSEIINLKNKVLNVEKKWDKYKQELLDKEKEIKECQQQIKDMGNEIFTVSNSLHSSETKINNHLHRKICGRIENYFLNIISPSGREEVEKEIKKNKSKIDVYVKIINQEYPNYFKKIRGEGIDYSNFLHYINIFRINNNAECHDTTKVNYDSILRILKEYFDNAFDFKKPLDFMITNFEEFKVYIFDPKYELDKDLYTIFQKKEEDAEH